MKRKERLVLGKEYKYKVYDKEIGTFTGEYMGSQEGFKKHTFNRYFKGLFSIRGRNKMNVNVKVYKAINGKKGTFLGEGYDIKDAVNDALIMGTLKWEDFRDGINTLDDVVDYILGATQDYVIEREEK